jgi:hypothetical protein
MIKKEAGTYNDRGSEDKHTERILSHYKQ